MGGFTLTPGRNSRFRLRLFATSGKRSFLRRRLCSSQTLPRSGYHAGVCATKTMDYTASTTILLYTQPFHGDSVHPRVETTSSACGLACFVRFGIGMLRTSLPRLGSLNQPFLEDVSLDSRSCVRLCGYKGDFLSSTHVRRRRLLRSYGAVVLKIVIRKCRI